MKTSWTEGNVPPTRERGLPHEIHFWKYNGDIWILRDTNRQEGIPTWCRWREGQAIKDCGLEYVKEQS